MISDRAREILARRGITLRSDAVPAIPLPPKPSSTSSTTIFPTTKPPAATLPRESAPAVSVVPEPAPAQQKTASHTPVTQKKDAKPKVAKPKKDQAKGRAKPATTPIVRPSEIMASEAMASETMAETAIQDLGLDAEILELATKGRRPTDEQVAVIQACRRMGRGAALRLIAYAGAGKTSTLKLAGSVLGGGGLYLAFNKSIAQDGATAFKPFGIESKTCHGLAYGALALRGKPAKQNADWVRSYVRNGWLDDSATNGVREDRQASLTARVFAKFAASDAAGPTAQHVAAALDDAGFAAPRERPTDKKEAKKADRRREQREALEPLLLRQASALWDGIFDGDGEGWRRDGKELTFDSYLKVFERSRDVVRNTFAAYRFVLLDEAQDTNPVQISIVEQARASGCMVVAVGDQFQQIYSWRGAVDALEILSGEALYLSASFRFGQEIAAFAAEILDYRPTGGLPVPLRGLGPVGRVVPTADPTARVTLCRTNLGVIRTAGAAALRGCTVHVVGINSIQELSDELDSVVALQAGETYKIRVDALRRFASWKDLEDEATLTDDPDLRYFVDLGKDTKLAQMIAAIRTMQRPENDASIVVSTAHKAKGAEWDVVGLADDFPGPQRALKRYRAAVAKGDSAGAKAAVEEFHVLYVAATRAKVELRVAARLYTDIMGYDWRLDVDKE